MGKLRACQSSTYYLRLKRDDSGDEGPGSQHWSVERKQHVRRTQRTTYHCHWRPALLFTVAGQPRPHRLEGRGMATLVQWVVTRPPSYSTVSYIDFSHSQAGATPDSVQIPAADTECSVHTTTIFNLMVTIYCEYFI